MAKRDEEETGLKASVVKALPIGWKEEADSMGEAELRQIIIESSNTIRETDQEMEADEKLQGAKELLKDLASGYKDVKKSQNAKIKYALHLLSQQGKL